MHWLSQVFVVYCQLGSIIQDDQLQLNLLLTQEPLQLSEVYIPLKPKIHELQLQRYLFTAQAELALVQLDVVQLLLQTHDQFDIIQQAVDQRLLLVPDAQTFIVVPHSQFTAQAELALVQLDVVQLLVQAHDHVSVCQHQLFVSEVDDHNVQDQRVVLSHNQFTAQAELVLVQLDVVQPLFQAHDHVSVCQHQLFVSEVDDHNVQDQRVVLSHNQFTAPLLTQEESAIVQNATCDQLEHFRVRLPQVAKLSDHQVHVTQLPAVVPQLGSLYHLQFAVTHPSDHWQDHI